MRLQLDLHEPPLSQVGLGNGGVNRSLFVSSDAADFKAVSNKSYACSWKSQVTPLLVQIL